ncbi:hypothetical protein ZWY2020_059643 [Hordeum vulgare]|nr:hypothetical protein ZWY2020_059643 [Hordeum vulgare]
MAGMNLHRIASAIVRFIGTEIHRSTRSHGIGVPHHWGSGNGRRGCRSRRAHHDHPDSAAADHAGPSNPPSAIHHAYQAPSMPAFIAPPAFVAPQMDWLLEDAGGVFCPVHGYGPCPPPPATPPPEPEIVEGPTYPDLPTPTPADEELLAPPGYGLVPAMAEWEVTPTEADEAGATIPDLKTATDVKIENGASPRRPPPTARRILRRFAAALERHRPGLRSGSWAKLASTFPATPRRGRPPSEACRREAPSAAAVTGFVGWLWNGGNRPQPHHLPSL